METKKVMLEETGQVQDLAYENERLERYRWYIRGMELFCAIHEEIGEAQKSYNDYCWKNRGNLVDVVNELCQIISPLDELKDILRKREIWQQK